MQKPVHVHKENFPSKSEKSSAFIRIKPHCPRSAHATMLHNLNLEIGVPWAPYTNNNLSRTLYCLGAHEWCQKLRIAIWGSSQDCKR